MIVVTSWCANTEYVDSLIFYLVFIRYTTLDMGKIFLLQIAAGTLPKRSWTEREDI